MAIDDDENLPLLSKSDARREENPWQKLTRSPRRCKVSCGVLATLIFIAGLTLMLGVQHMANRPQSKHLHPFIHNVLMSSFSGFGVQEAKDLPPIIIVPGTGGSQLEGKLNPSLGILCSRLDNMLKVNSSDNWFTLWVSKLELLTKCFVDYGKLIYDPATHTTSNSKDAEIRVPGFGNTTTVEWLTPDKSSVGRYFYDVVDTLVSLGYERGTTVKAAPYDFRKAANEHSEYLDNMKNLIESTYSNINRKVILMTHSLGSKLTQYFLSKQSLSWKSRYLDSVIHINPAFAGSVKSVLVYTVGDDLGSRWLSSEAMKEVESTFPSITWLLPSPSIFQNQSLVKTPSKVFTAFDYDHFFDAANISNGWNMYQDVADLDGEFPAPQIETFIVYGTHVPTVEEVIFDDESMSGTPKKIMGAGDGTVNLKSLQVYKKWYKEQSQPIHVKTFYKAMHMAILQHRPFLEYLTAIISNKTGQS